MDCGLLYPRRHILHGEVLMGFAFAALLFGGGCYSGLTQNRTQAFIASEKVGWASGMKREVGFLSDSQEGLRNLTRLSPFIFSLILALAKKPLRTGPFEPIYKENG